MDEELEKLGKELREMEKELLALVQRQRRRLAIMSLVFHSAMFGIFTLLGTKGGLWMVFFIPAATMVIRGYKSTKSIYNIFSDPAKAQKYNDQASKALS